MAITRTITGDGGTICRGVKRRTALGAFVAGHVVGADGIRVRRSGAQAAIRVAEVRGTGCGRYKTAGAVELVAGNAGPAAVIRRCVPSEGNGTGGRSRRPQIGGHGWRRSNA